MGRGLWCGARRPRVRFPRGGAPSWADGRESGPHRRPDAGRRLPTTQSARSTGCLFHRRATLSESLSFSKLVRSCQFSVLHSPCALHYAFRTSKAARTRTRRRLHLLGGRASRSVMIRLGITLSKGTDQELNGIYRRIKGTSMIIIRADKRRFGLGGSSMEEADIGRR